MELTKGQKISIAKKGKSLPHTEEWNKNIGIANTGKKRPWAIKNLGIYGNGLIAEKNLNWKGGPIKKPCDYCGKINEYYPNRVKSQKHFFCNVVCMGNYKKGKPFIVITDEIRERLKKPKPEWWRKKIGESHIGIKVPESAKIKIRKKTIERLASGGMPNKETSIEKEIKKELIKKKIKFQQNIPLLKITIVDFFLPDSKTVIYCDGDYWHNLPGVQEKDKRQTEALISNGYKVFRFWEHEIKKSPEACMNRIF